MGFQRAIIAAPGTGALRGRFGKEAMLTGLTGRSPTGVCRPNTDIGIGGMPIFLEWNLDILSYEWSTVAFSL